MSTEINRYYLEINSSEEIKEIGNLSPEFKILNLKPPNFQLNKFFYKNIGKKHRWTDRLIWTDLQWIDYVQDKKTDTFVLKKNTDMVGYFELIHHQNTNEVEIAYLGLLEEYINKFEVIILETSIHKYNKDAPLFDEVLSYMKDKNYKLFDIFDMKRLGNDNSFLLQFDCVFVKNNSKLLDVDLG